MALYCIVLNDYGIDLFITALLFFRFWLFGRDFWISRVIWIMHYLLFYLCISKRNSTNCSRYLQKCAILTHMFPLFFCYTSACTFPFHVLNVQSGCFVRISTKYFGFVDTGDGVVRCVALSEIIFSRTIGR